MTYYISVIISITLFIYYFFTRTFNHWKKKNVKGPVPIPFFGNLIDMALRRKHAGIIYKEIYDRYSNEKVVGIYRMTSPSLLIRDLDIVKEILIKDFEVFPDRALEFSKEKLGDNLFHCDIDTWRLLRNHITPAFTSGKLRSTFYLLDERGERLIDYIEKAYLKQPDQNMYGMFRKYAIATLTATLFNLDFNTFDDECKLIDIIDKSIFTQSYFNELDMLYPGVLKKYNLSFYGKTLNKFCHEIAQTMIDQRKSCDQSGSGNIMDSLINLSHHAIEPNNSAEYSNTKISDSVIAGQVFVLYAAGYGNNTLSLCYAMYHIAKNPDVQDRLIAEIDEVLQKYDGKFTYDSLKEMKYLDMVFAETLRMHPLTNSLSRGAKQNYTIKSIDLTIDKGTAVVISPYAIHHDAKHYPNPEKFEPERFMPELARDRHPCAYLPFGAGPRSCLGTQFAKVQFGVCIVKLLSRFRVQNSTRNKFAMNYDPRRTLLSPGEELFIHILPRETCGRDRLRKSNTTG